jgi:hypothetical protein
LGTESGAQARDTVRQDTRAPENDEDLYQQFLKWRKSNQTDAKP